MGTHTVLVVDDDIEVVRLMRGYLEQAGYRVLVAHDGATAFHCLRADRPDLLLVDLMLPEKDGWEVTRLVRSDPHLRHMPIIMLTARVDEVDRILGLEMGADDYVTKPYSPREVVARVKARLRTFGEGEHGVEKPLRAGALQLDPAKHAAWRDGQRLNLTYTEFRLLQLLMQASGRVFTRDELIERGLGSNYSGLDRTLDSHMRNLRKKVEPDSRQPAYIHTVYGVGYRFHAPEESAT